MKSLAFNSTVVLQAKGKPVGTGFLVAESGLLATCCHILNVFQSPEQAIDQVLEFVPLAARDPVKPQDQVHGDNDDGADSDGETAATVGRATVTRFYDVENDVALLQIQGERPAGLEVIKLIRSEHPLVEQGTNFSLVGYAKVPDDPRVYYGYFVAEGRVKGRIARGSVPILQLDCKNLLQGLSGGPIYVADLGGVVGMQSRRLILPPNQSNFGRDIGFACVSEAIAALAPDVLELHEPRLNIAAAFNPQMLQVTNGINAQMVVLGDLKLTKSWSRPAEISWPSQTIIPRPTELQFIHQQLVGTEEQSSSAKRLVLWGSSGSGKSLLVEEYARQYGDDKNYPGGVLYVNLGQIFEPQQDLQSVLAKWAEYVYGDTRKLTELLGKQRVDIKPKNIKQLLSGHGNMLVILDDVYQGEHVKQVLAALPVVETHLLMTTMSKECLEGLGITPQFFPVKGLMPEDAIAFLQESLTQFPIKRLEQLAATFDYHAQALYLITAELKQSTNPETVIQNLLDKRDHEVLAPIRTAFKYSYQQLSSTEAQRQFRQLGVICPPPASFSEALAAALWNIDNNQARQFLNRLQGRTLVTATAKQRWSMNTLSYTFACDLADEDFELISQAFDRYSQYVYDLAIAGTAWQLNHPDLPHLKYLGNQLIQQFATDSLIDIDVLENTLSTDNLTDIELEGHQTPSENQKTEWLKITRYITSARLYLLQPEAQELAKRWLRALIAIGLVLDESAIAALGFFLLGQWYWVYGHAQGDSEQQAIQMFDQASTLGHKVNDIQAVGYALSNKGNVLRLQGKTLEALKTFTEAWEAVDTADSGDWELRVTLLLNLSSQYLNINDHDQARQYLEQATELCDPTVGTEEAITNLTCEIAKQLSVIYISRSQPQDSMACLQAARQKAIAIKNNRAVSELDISIGYSHLHMGNSEEAQQTFQTVLEQAVLLSYPQLRSPALTGLAAVYFTNGEFSDARNLLQEALELLGRYPDKSHEAKVLAHLGEVACAMNEPGDALANLKQALPLLHTVQDTTTAVQTLNTIGLIYQQTNRISEGLDFLKGQLPQIRQLNNKGAEGTILNWLAQLFNNAGDVSQAMAYFDEAQPLIKEIDNDIERAMIQTVTVNLYLFSGKIDKAADQAEKVIKIWRKLKNYTKLSEALILLANIRFRQADIDKVEKLLKEVDALTQNTIIQEDEQSYVRSLYYNLRGMLELQAANVDQACFERAEQMFERSMQINKVVQNPEIRIINLTNLGTIYLNKQDFQKAKEFFQESLTAARQQESPPHIAATLSNLGFLDYIKGDIPQATQHFDEAIEVMEQVGITTDAANQNIELLRLLVQHIRQEKTENLPETSLELLLSAENWQNLRFILEIRKESFLTDQAYHIINATLQYAEHHGMSSLKNVLHFYRSLIEDIYRNTQHFPSVQAMQQYRESSAAEHWWAVLQRQNRNYGIALTHINRVLEVTANMDTDALIERGWIHRGLGRLHEAILDFDQALKVHRQDYRPLQGKGVALLELGKIQEAITMLAKAIELAPDDPFNHYWRGVAYQYLEDFKSALENLDQAVQHSPKDGHHRYRRALLYLANQQFKEARQELTNTIHLDQNKKNNSALAFDYFWRGVANDQLGDTEGAQLDWKTGRDYVQVGISRWSIPLYMSVTKPALDANFDVDPSPEQAVDEYLQLLNKSYPWHIIHVHIQNHTILQRLYPNRTCHSKIKSILIEKLDASKGI